jgi:hypothetical protein
MWSDQSTGLDYQRTSLKKQLSKPRINGFAFQSQHAEYAFMDTSKRFTFDETMQCFDTQRKLSQS